MKSKQKTKQIILVLVIIFAISNFSNNTFSDDQDNWNDSVGIQDENNVKHPKKSGAYTESFIHIDGNWTDAIGKGWFSGDGSWGNPYVIENVTINAISSPTGSGIYINNSKNDYFVIKNCTVYNAGSIWDDAGIKLENTSNGTLINNNCSNSNWVGICIINDCENNTISGNTVNDNTQHGIYIRIDGNNNTISLNTANKNGWAGIRIVNNCNHNTLSENNVNDNLKEGISLYNNCNNNTILENSANNNDDHGIYLENDCDDNIISENSVNDNDEYGICLDLNCDNNTISRNSANINDYYGIYLKLDCNNNTISRNSASSNIEYGIYLYYCKDNIILGNLIKDNQKYGIVLVGATCENNRIYKNSLKGNVLAHAYDSGTNNHWNYTEIGNYWDNHTTPDLDNDGIIDDPYTWIIGSANSNDSFPLTENPAHDGEKIYINDFGVSIRDWYNTVRLKAWCTGSGTYADPYIIEDLEIDGDGSGSGILIEESNAFFKIKNCKVYNCTDGIKLSQTDYGSLTDNYCFNSEKGILLTNDCDNNTILNNNVYDNTGSGIALITYCNNNSILENTVYGPLQDNGIRLSNNCNYNNITGNTVYNNSDYQIWLELNCHNNDISGNTVNFYGSNNRGIFLEDNCDINQIMENIIIGHSMGVGIYLYTNCENNIIFNNTITKPLTHFSLLRGIFLFVNCIDNIIANNTLTNHLFGISVAESNENIIANNTLKNNWYDMDIDRSQNITISGNVMVEGGIVLRGGLYSHYSSHKIYTNNTINGRIVYYYVEQNGLSDSNFLSAGQVILIRCNNSNISNLNVSQVCYGIHLYNSHDNTITNNTGNRCDNAIYLENDCDYNNITGNIANKSSYGIYLENDCDYNNITRNFSNESLYGIYLYKYCDYNNITGNRAINSYHDGIYLENDCDFNNITGNTVNNNNEYGIYLYNDCDFNNITGNRAINNDYCGIYLKNNCDFNNITGNILSNNGYYVEILSDLTNGGLCLSSSDNNFIWNNNFSGNSVNANDTGIINYWNITTIGNYWGDYSGTDADDDGVGDIPYNIPGTAGSQDFLPIYWDPPVLKVIVPKKSQNFGSTAPTFNITVIEGLGDYFWCELLGIGKTMNLTKLNGVFNENISVSINQTLWSSLPDGKVTFRFYCNDTKSYIGYINFYVIKGFPPTILGDDDDDDDDGEEEIEFLGPTLIIIGITSAIAVAAIAIYLIRKRRLLRE